MCWCKFSYLLYEVSHMVWVPCGLMELLSKTPYGRLHILPSTHTVSPRPTSPVTHCDSPTLGPVEEHEDKLVDELLERASNADEVADVDSGDVAVKVDKDVAKLRREFYPVISVT